MVSELIDAAPSRGDSGFQLKAVFDTDPFKACDRKGFATKTSPLSPSKHVSDYYSTSNAEKKSASRRLISRCTICPPLKALPLASYYKFHRLLASPTQSDTNQTRTTTISLPPLVNIPTPIVMAEVNEKMPPNGVHNKLLEQVIRTPERQPSPQPTHLSVPGASPHRVLHEEGSGYVAPVFEGKEQQMEQGTLAK